MISEWILIIILSGNNASSSNVEFESKQACIQASSQIHLKIDPSSYEVIQCFKKYK